MYTHRSDSPGIISLMAMAVEVLDSWNRSLHLFYQH